MGSHGSFVQQGGGVWCVLKVHPKKEKGKSQTNSSPCCCVLRKWKQDLGIQRRQQQHMWPEKWREEVGSEFWLLHSDLAPHKAPLAAPTCQEAHEAHRVPTPLSHWPCISLPWWPCLVDLLVGISWLQIPDVQSKSYELFNLMRPPTAVTRLLI